MMFNDSCIVCKGSLSIGYQEWHFFCRNCGYEKSKLHPGINMEKPHQLVDEKIRENGLKAIRMQNFKTLINYIKSIKPAGGYLLDVGCAHGWFLEAAQSDFHVLGLEPDENLAAAVSERGLPIITGYFPEAIDKSKKFDVIVFNDVIEHIFDVTGAINSCYLNLNQNGLLVLTVPNSNGIFYRLSQLCSRIGVTVFFERLWQKNLPSPHLHYFNSNNMIRLLKSHKFDVQVKGSLPTLHVTGLYSRISVTGNIGHGVCCFVYLLIVFFLPLLKLLQKDIIYIIAKRE